MWWASACTGTRSHGTRSSRTRRRGAPSASSSWAASRPCHARGHPENRSGGRWCQALSRRAEGTWPCWRPAVGSDPGARSTGDGRQAGEVVAMIIEVSTASTFSASTTSASTCFCTASATSGQPSPLRPAQATLQATSWRAMSSRREEEHHDPARRPGLLRHVRLVRRREVIKKFHATGGLVPITRRSEQRLHRAPGGDGIWGRAGLLRSHAEGPPSLDRGRPESEGVRGTTNMFFESYSAAPTRTWLLLVDAFDSVPISMSLRPTRPSVADSALYFTNDEHGVRSTEQHGADAARSRLDRSPR